MIILYDVLVSSVVVQFITYVMFNLVDNYILCYITT